MFLKMDVGKICYVSVNICISILFFLLGVFEGITKIIKPMICFSVSKQDQISHFKYNINIF